MMRSEINVKRHSADNAARGANIGIVATLQSISNTSPQVLKSTPPNGAVNRTIGVLHGEDFG
jgi:hypothetical protein